MQHAIGDNNAVTFAETFYRVLVSGLSIDEAVAFGRIAVAQIDICKWGVPVLYLRAPDGVIFPEYVTDSTLENTRKQIKIAVRQHVKALKGKLVGAEVAQITRGKIDIKQEISSVSKNGSVVAVNGRQMDGGSVEVEQAVEETDDNGSVIGVRLDRF